MIFTLRTSPNFALVEISFDPPTSSAFECESNEISRSLKTESRLFPPIDGLDRRIEEIFGREEWKFIGIAKTIRRDSNVEKTKRRTIGRDQSASPGTNRTKQRNSGEVDRSTYRFQLFSSKFISSRTNVKCWRNDVKRSNSTLQKNWGENWKI